MPDRHANRLSHRSIILAMPKRKGIECPICKGFVSPVTRAQTLTEALDRHIKLTHAIVTQAKRVAVAETVEEAPPPTPTQALPAPTRRRKKLVAPVEAPRRRLVRKRP
jgi:hypothetical protein